MNAKRAVKATYESITADIKANNVSPLYLLVGEENYFADKIVSMLKANFFGNDATNNINFFNFYAEEISPADVLSQAETYSFFSEKKLIVVNNVQKYSASLINEFAEYAKSPVSTNCIVFTGSKIDKRSSFYKTASKNGVFLESKVLYDNQAKDWLIRQFRNYDKKLSPQAADKFLNLVGLSLANLEMEIEKVLLYIDSKSSVSPEDVVAVVSPQKEYDHFALLEAILNKDKKTALKILFAIIGEGKNYAEIIGLLRWQLVKRIVPGKDLVDKRASNSEIASALRMPPFFVDKFVGQMRKFSKKDIASYFDYVFEADKMIKTSYLPVNIVLEKLIVNITS